MFPYTQDEYKRRNWKKQIEAVKVSSWRERKLKQELIALLAHENASIAIIQFNGRRSQLLSSNHGQGLSWAPHSSFLWGLIKIFIGLFVKISSTGSLLRRTLQSEEPKIKSISTSSKEIFSDNKYNPIEPIENELFEKLIYDKPNEALQIISSHIEHLITQNTDATEETKVEEINIVLERLYALRLRLEPMDYFHVLNAIAQHAPAQTLYFLYQHYNKCNDALNEHEFLELHLMAQTLMDHCVRANENIHQHLYNIHNLLILMNVTPAKDATSSPIDDLMLSANCTKKSIHSALDNVYRLNHNQIIENLKKQIKEHPSLKTKYLQIIRSFDESPIHILTTQLQLKDKKTTPISPLIYLFSRLAMEQVLVDHFANLDNTLWNGLGLESAAQGSLTIQLLSEYLLGTWDYQALTTKTETTTAASFLQISPGNSLIFSSFRDIEQYWVAPLILNLNHGGINSAKTTILNKSKGVPLTSNQVEWIVSRVQHYLPQNEVSETTRQLRDIFSLQDWISPLLDIMENNSTQVFETAQAQINQNFTYLADGTKQLNEQQIAILVKFMTGKESFNKNGDRSVEFLGKILAYNRQKDNSTSDTVTNEHTPLIANSFYSSRRNTANENKVAKNEDATYDIGNQLF